jgi:cytochrome c553
MKLIAKVFSAIICLSVLINCNHAKMREENNSSANTDESHNQGLNCMNCHKKGGEGEGWFTIAGTAFRSNGASASNVIVKLYSQPGGQGELKKQITGDLLGNFFTTDLFGFGNGLYPSIEFEGNTKFMSSPISKGACNSCHGISTGNIVAD